MELGRLEYMVPTPSSVAIECRDFRFVTFVELELGGTGSFRKASSESILTMVTSNSAFKSWGNSGSRSVGSKGPTAICTKEALALGTTGLDRSSEIEVSEAP